MNKQGNQDDFLKKRGTCLPEKEMNFLSLDCFGFQSCLFIFEVPLAKWLEMARRGTYTDFLGLLENGIWEDSQWM